MNYHNDGIGSPVTRVLRFFAMRTPVVGLLSFLVFLCLSLTTDVCQGQSPKARGRTKSVENNLIRPEYYAALDFYEDGMTGQAFVGFEQAFEQSRQINNQRGIDSIPPLVLMGECLLTQGDIGAALERYEAALAISTRCSQWLQLLGTPPQSDRAEQRYREVNWTVANSRTASYTSTNDLWPILIGNQDALLELDGMKRDTGKPVNVDALEIMRCQAIALRRRQLLQGKLTPFNPMSPVLSKVFEVQKIGNLHESIRVAEKVCNALAMLSTDTNRSLVIQQLKQNLSLPDGNDHSLTPVALLALSDLAIDSDDITSAEDYALEASLCAARAQQAEHVEEAIELWSMCAGQNQRDAAITNRILQQVATWANSRSRLVAIRAQVELVRQAALRGDTEGAKKQSSTATSMLLPQPILLPRMEATVSYSLARVAFLDGNIEQGIQKIDESLAGLKGASDLSCASPTLYQLALARKLAEEKNINRDQAETVLDSLLHSDRIGRWKTSIVEQLILLTADKLPYVRLFLQSQLATENAPAHLAAWDTWRAHRFRQSSVLNGRLLALRQSIHADNSLLTEREASEREVLKRALPGLLQTGESMQRWIHETRNGPKFDTRKWNEEETKRWDALIRLSASQESALWSAAISPVHVPTNFPPKLDLPKLIECLRNQDVVISFGFIDQAVWGYVVTKEETHYWKLENKDKLLVDLQSIHQAISQGETLQSKKLSESLLRFGTVLFPEKIRQLLTNQGRWIVVPDGPLWQFPFELLLLPGGNPGTPAISEHPICYSPTMGCIPFLIDRKPELAKLKVLQQSPEFWGKNPAHAQTIETQTEESLTDYVHLNPATFSPPSRYLKLACDRFVPLQIAPWNDPNALPLGFEKASGAVPLSAWNPLPWGTPRELWILGSEFTLPIVDTTGDEWLKVTLSLIAQGTKQMYFSRWHVGGESTGLFLRGLNDSLEGSSFSDAFQRAIATLWIEELNTQYEPSLINQGSQPERVLGEIPKFWSGYMCIGDSISP
jgi:hypothetical protein